MASGFDFFIQPRGPQIDVSLFPDAYSKGVSAGKELGSPLGSVVSGVERGLQITEDIQQNVLRQQQIEDIPLDRKIKEERLKQIEEARIVQSLKLEREALLRSEAFDAEKEKLLNDVTQLRTKRQTTDKVNAFKDSYNASDAETQRNMLFDPNNGEVFAADPAYYKQQLSVQYPGFNERQREAADVYLQRSAIGEYDRRKAIENQENFRASQEQLISGKYGGITSAISQKLKKPPEDSLDDIEVVPADTFVKDPLTNKIKLDPITKQRITRKDPTAASAAGAWDIISKAPGSEGLVLYEAAPKEFGEERDKYIGYKSRAEGKYAEWAIRDQENKDKRRKQIEQEQSSGIQMATPEQEAALVSKRESEPLELKSYFDIQFPELAPVIKDIITPDLKALEKGILEGIEAPEKVTIETLQNQQRLVNSTAKAISDARYAESEAVRSQYTKSKIDSINKSIDDSLPPSGTMPEEIREKYKNILGTQKIDDPKDLYFLDNQSAILKQMQEAVDAYIAQLNARKLQPAKSSAVKQRKISFLNKVRSGVQ